MDGPRKGTCDVIGGSTHFGQWVECAVREFAVPSRNAAPPACPGFPRPPDSLLGSASACSGYDLVLPLKPDPVRNRVPCVTGLN